MNNEIAKLLQELEQTADPSTSVEPFKVRSACARAAKVIKELYAEKEPVDS